MQGQLAQQQQQIQSLSNQQQQAQQQQQQQTQSASSSSAATGVFGLLPLVDTRGLGKPEVFRGEAASFNDGNFVLRSYLGALDKRFQTLLARCESSELPLWNRGLSPEEQGLSTQLYYILVMLCRERALDKLRNSGENEGLEAYRQLYLVYNPRLKTRYVGLLLEILRYKFEGDLVTCIDAFERKVREYEKQSGKDIDDETIIGIVILGVTDASVKEHLVRHSPLRQWTLVQPLRGARKAKKARARAKTAKERKEKERKATKEAVRFPLRLPRKVLACTARSRVTPKRSVGRDLQT